MPSNSQGAVRWLRDIQYHIGKAHSFAECMDFTAFSADDMRVFAVTRCLEIVSEASRRLPQELKARHPGVEWEQMAAAGNVYRHEYGSVATLRVWETLTDHLPALLAVVEAEIQQAEPEESEPDHEPDIEP